ncbi:MAG: hypothetical protein Q8K30_00785 [Candidatus Gracilibacteria bacterium]|nr:hypothetical protein [Candidatus Gracilibacteria bacterium]
MIKTKIKKAIALSGIVAITASSLVSSGLGTAYAVLQIGTGSVTGTGAFNTSIMWDETYTAASASGSVSGILVKARVLPTLTMEISTGTIDLGNLTANVAASGSLFIEVGTNAKSGVSITARSGSGGLTKTDDNSVQINNLFTDGVDESYTFSSTPNVTNDSNAPAFTSTGLTSTQVFNNIIEHTVYSTNKPENKNLVDDVEFVVTATTKDETPAGYYEDTITFTVTGNF